MGPGEDRDELRRLLVERGVTGADSLLDDLGDGDYAAAMGAIHWWSEMPKVGAHAVGTGLLVSRIRSGGMPGFKPAGERDELGGTQGVTKAVLATVRGSVLGTEGVFDREEAARHFANLTERLNLTADALLDAAVGPGWAKTPPHPASRRGWAINGWEYPDEYGGVRYEMLTAAGRKPPDTAALREPTESFWSWACRFWRWGDDEEAEVLRLAERAAKARQLAAEVAERERQERREAAERADDAARALTARPPREYDEPYW